MKILKGGGFTLILLLIIAGTLRVLYPPVPVLIKSLIPISGGAEAGRLTFTSRLPLFKTSWLQIIGAPNETPETLAFIRSYVEALQKTDEKVAVILAASSAIDRMMTGVQHAPVKIDSTNLAALAQTLRAAQARNLKVLLILSSVDGTHRMGPTVLRYLEKEFELQIPALVLANLALTEDAEAGLLPPCEGSPYSQSGLVFDLGCNILSLSKRAQVEKPPLDQDLISIEEESVDEELVAIYRARR